MFLQGIGIVFGIVGLCSLFEAVWFWRILPAIKRCQFLLFGCGLPVFGLQWILYENWKEMNVSTTLFLAGLTANNLGLLLVAWQKHKKDQLADEMAKIDHWLHA